MFIAHLPNSFFNWRLNLVRSMRTNACITFMVLVLTNERTKHDDVYTESIPFWAAKKVPIGKVLDRSRSGWWYIASFVFGTASCHKTWKKSSLFSNSGLGKWMDIPPWKRPLFLGHDFSCEPYRQFYLKLNIKGGMYPVYRMVLRMSGGRGRIASFGLFRTAAVLELRIELADAYSIVRICFWVPLNRQGSCLVPYEIWRQVIHLSVKKLKQLVTKSWSRRSKSFLKKSSTFSNSVSAAVKVSPFVCFSHFIPFIFPPEWHGLWFGILH